MEFKMVKLILASVSLAVLSLPALACVGAGCGGGSLNPVPGPLVGAGLPVIAVGYGAYWLVRRYRRKPD
jgi:hypothetical protein